MKRLMFLFNVKTLTILATATAVAVIGGSPVSAAPNGGALTSGAVQAKPGGIVVNATGGYYDPARSTYVVAPVRSADSIGAGLQARPGGIVKEPTGGYYDPARSTYVPSSVETKPTSVVLSARGFDWADAFAGAAATGTTLLVVGAAVLTIRRRSLVA